MTRALSNSAYDVARLRSRLRNSLSFTVESAHTEHAHRYQRTDTGRLAWSVTTKLGFVDKPWLSAWRIKRAVEYIRENLPRLLAGDEGVLAEASGAGDRFRDKAAGIGTTAHDAFDSFLTEWIDKDKRPEGSSVVFLEANCRKAGTEPRGEEIAACRSFDLFVEGHEIIPLASEIRVWYEEGKDCFAGTVDACFLWLTVYKGREGDKGHAHSYTPQTSGQWWCTCDREVTPALVLADWKSSNSIINHDDYALQGTAYIKAIEKAVGVRFDAGWVVRVGKTRAEYQVCRIVDTKQAWREFITISRAFDSKEEREKKGLLEDMAKKEKISLYA